jgi:hypothetical protein
MPIKQREPLEIEEIWASALKEVQQAGAFFYQNIAKHSLNLRINRGCDE